MTYRAFGKQVKRGDEHIADAADETYAQIIADALNGERCPTAGVTRMLAERYGSDRVDLVMMREVRDMINNPSVVIEAKNIADNTNIVFRDGKPYAAHVWQRQQDEYACSCGARWDVADGDDHP